MACGLGRAGTGEPSDDVIEPGMDMANVSLDFGSDDEEAVVAGTARVWSGGVDGCCSAGEVALMRWCPVRI